jgi:hypothetical protein
MSSNNHKRSASPSGDRDARLNKRQKREDDDEKKDEKEEKKSVNQMDLKEEKKQREVKEDINASVLQFSDPDLVVGTIDRDLICAICFALLSKPIGTYCFLLPFFVAHSKTFLVCIPLFQVSIVVTCFVKVVSEDWLRKLALWTTSLLVLLTLLPSFN